MSDLITQLRNRWFALKGAGPLPELHVLNGYPGTTESSFRSFIASGFVTPFTRNNNYRTVYAELPKGNWRLECTDPDMKLVRSLVNDTFTLHTSRPAFNRAWTISNDGPIVIQCAHNPSSEIPEGTTFLIKKA